MPIPKPDHPEGHPHNRKANAPQGDPVYAARDRITSGDGHADQ